MNSCARRPDVNKVVDINPTKPLVKIKPTGKDDEEIDDGDDESSEKRRKKRKINAAKTQQRQHDDQVHTKQLLALQN